MALCWQNLPYRIRYCVQVSKLLSWLAEGMHGISNRMQHKEMILSRTDKML